MVHTQTNNPDPSEHLSEKYMAVVFMDLDDTIFQTPRKCGPGTLHPAALGLDGKPSSYCTPQQQSLLQMLEGRSLVIPTTARNQESFNRVHLNFGQGAILDHGGLIVRPDGELDNNWYDRMCELTNQAKPMLLAIQSLAEEIIRREDLSCRVRIIADQGLNFYVLIKNSTSSVDQLAIIKEQIEEVCLHTYGAWIHSNDNNLAILPNFLTKTSAVAYFLQTYIQPLYPQLPIIGMGDSLSDLDFLRLCTFMMIPSKSQLAQSFDHRREKEKDHGN